MNRRMLRQVLECGNGACDIAAFGLKRALTDWIARMERADAKAVNSLRSSPHSKTLARGITVHGHYSLIIVDPQDHVHILDVDQISKIHLLPRRGSTRKAV